MAGNPNWIDQWSVADLAVLVEKREVDRKKFAEIGLEMGRGMKSCHRRYTKLVRERPAPVIVAPEPAPKPLSFHAALGIQTYEHHQATTDYCSGFVRGEYFAPHCYRERITLAKVLA